MAGEAGYNESSVVLPSLFGQPGQALENAIDRKQQDKLFDYRMKKEADEDEWRKLNLIRDLTDLDKHQTGSDVANAIGNRQASAILQKYTAEAKKMSPSELMGNVQRDMQGTITGMDAMKDELAVSDQQLAFLKQKFPFIDAGSLARKMREDVIQRRIKGDETFVNPMEIQPSQLNLSDPEFLSDFVVSDKDLQESITNPKGLEDIGVATGNITENIEFKGKKSPWKQENFTKEDLEKGGGFLPKGFVPELKTKEQPISTDILKGAKGEQLMGVPDDVLQQFADGNEGLQLLSATKKKFPDYKDFSPEQKKAAQSTTLRGLLEQDKTNFRFDRSQRAPMQRTSNTFNMGAGGDALINKVYERIDKKMNDEVTKGFNGTRFNSLANDEQEVVRTAVKNAGYLDSNGEAAIGQSGENVFLSKDDNGKIKIYKVSDDGKLVKKPEYEITTLSYEGTNVPKQANVKGKIQTIAKGQTGDAITTPPKGSSYSIKGKNYSESELLDMGYTIDQIKKYKSK